MTASISKPSATLIACHARRSARLVVLCSILRSSGSSITANSLYKVDVTPTNSRVVSRWVRSVGDRCDGPFQALGDPSGRGGQDGAVTKSWPNWSTGAYEWGCDLQPMMI